MIRFSDFQKLALSFPDAEEQPHFALTSFRVKKKIFATYWEKEHRAMLRLPLQIQSVYCLMDPLAFYPVPGAWGKGGATFVDLKKVPVNIFREALRAAYHLVAPVQKPAANRKKK